MVQRPSREDFVHHLERKKRRKTRNAARVETLAACDVNININININITSFVRGGAIEENIESLCIFVNIRSCYYDGTYHQHNTCVHSLHHQDYAYYRY